MSLIVAGGSGAVGRCVVFEALRRVEITEVVVLTRSENTSDPAHILDFTLVADDGMSNGAEKTQADFAEGQKKNTECGEMRITKDMLRKLRLVTVDWEMLCSFWKEFQIRNNSESKENANESVGGEALCKSEEPVNSYSDAEYAEALSRYSNIFSGHKYIAVCLGTTRHDAGCSSAFWRCDYDYVVVFASVVRHFSSETISCISLLSASTASKNSILLYNKTKGRAEEAVIAMRFPRCCIYRPGLLDRGDRKRRAERIASIFLRAIPVSVVGRAIVGEYIFCSNGKHISPYGDPVSRSCAGKKMQASSSNSGDTYVFYNKEIQKEALMMA